MATSLQSIVESLTTCNPLLAASLVTSWISGQPVKDGEAWLRSELYESVSGPLEYRLNKEKDSHKRQKDFRDPLEYRLNKEKDSHKRQKNFRDPHPRIPWVDLSKAFVNSLVDTARKLVNQGVVESNDFENLATALNHADFCRLIAGELIRDPKCHVHNVVAK